MGIAFLWVVLSVAVGVWAKNKDQGGIGWFLLSMLISPLLGGIFLALSKNLRAEALLPNASTHVKCPACAELVLREATKCKHCGETLTPQPNNNAEILAERATGAAIRNWFIFGGLFVVVLMIVLAATK